MKQLQPEAGQPRRHHWVPQVYLRGFTQNGSKNSQLFVVSRDGKAFTTKPANVAAKRDFNRVQADGIDPNYIEKALGKGFEPHLGRALQQLSATKNFDDVEAWHYVLNLIALLAVRNPRMRENMGSFQAHILRVMLDLTLATRERYEARMQAMKRDGYAEGLPEATYEQVKEFHDRGEYTFEVPAARHVATEMHVFDTTLRLMLARRWVVCIAAPEAGGFITSDHPVCLTTTEGEASTRRRPLGYGLADTLVTFPITRELLALGFCDGISGVRELTRDEVAEFNGLICALSQNQIYAADDRFRLYVPDRDEPIRGSDLALHIRSRPLRSPAPGGRDTSGHAPSPDSLNPRNSIS